MNILEAFDLTGSLRDAGELAGCSHHTVARYVAKRDAGELGDDGPERRERIIDPFLPKIEEWVERSGAKIRADVAFDKLRALGFEGSERTVRRAVAEVKANHRRGRRRVYRPWITEPGMWAQWDWGTGPTVGGRATLLFCAWLAWSRFRVVIPVWDRKMATTISCLDRAMRAFGGVPTYWLTDNERTVTTGHVAGIAVRHPVSGRRRLLRRDDRDVGCRRTQNRRAVAATRLAPAAAGGAAPPAAVGGRAPRPLPATTQRPSQQAEAGRRPGFLALGDRPVAATGGGGGWGSGGVGWSNPTRSDCRTCVSRPPSCWPPRGRNAGTPPSDRAGLGWGGGGDGGCGGDPRGPRHATARARVW